MRPEIEGWFRREAEMASSLREERKREVVRWEFSTQEIWSYADMLRHSLDSDLLPDAKGAFHSCGYDQEGRPILLEHFDWKDDYASQRRTPTSEVWAEEFIAYSNGRLDVTRFVRGQLEAVYRLTFQNGLRVEEEAFLHECYQHTRFLYAGRDLRLQQAISERGQVFYEIAFGPRGEQTFYHYEKSHTQLCDDELEEACDYLNGASAERGSTNPAVKLLVEVATELNSIPWPARVHRTNDFVVYAVDFELGSLRKNLKASLPPERLAVLRSKRLF